MDANVDFSSIRTIRIHKEQFDAIEKKADTVIVTCIEDGRCMSFDRTELSNTSKQQMSVVGLLDIIKELKGLAETVNDNEDSIFQDQQNLAESCKIDIIDKLLELEI